MSDGGDGNFDGCECVFSHEFAMRRLLSLLRNGQAYCTDNECTDLTNPMTTPNDTTDNLMLMGLLTVGAVMLYYFRPNSLRRRQGDDLNKPMRVNNGNSDPPPPPPPTSN